jgi:osmotically-inducible protein OsmY
MDIRWTVAAGVVTGAGLMFLLDPQGGARRRALVRDKLVRVSNKGTEAADATARDLANRTKGAVSATRARLTRRAVSDDVLEARVRAKLGRVVSHPGAVRVTASEGRVALEGPILTHEAARLLSTAWRVRGVRDVENRLELHDEPGDVPALQGGATRSGGRRELMQGTWSPTTRLLVSTLGVTALGAGLMATRR